jgi:DNA invertase Pin-like site-specific DNA recombinase
LGRSLRHLIDTVAELQQRDVGFRSLQENIDTTTPGGKLIFHIFGALAEFERHAEFGMSFVMPSLGLCRERNAEAAR